MNTILLRYGPLCVRVLSEKKITIPLPLEHEEFPMWISPMQVDICFHQLETPLQEKKNRNLPIVLQKFYSTIEELGVSFLPPEQHCNAWWEENGVIFAQFPYATDRFLLSIFPEEKKVEIVGNERNINRVILDLLTSYTSQPPLHGAAVKKDDRAILILANSGGGKTRMMKELVKLGFTYIADEEIFWNGDRVISCGRISVGKYEWEDQLFDCSSQDDLGCKVSNVFLLRNRSEKKFSPVLLPFISKQSFWAQSLVDSEDIGMLERLSKAQNCYEQILSGAKIVDVDHSCFEQAVNQIVQLSL